MKLIKSIIFLVVALCIMIPMFAQCAEADKPADNMQILREKIKADKKFVVSEGMQLTESEAKAFWPVYEAYQKDLDALDNRAIALIKSYADAWNAKSLDNKIAKRLTSDFLSIQTDEAKLMKSYVPKLSKALPAYKVTRYVQIENKIRAIIKYDLAGKIPLFPKID